MIVVVCPALAVTGGPEALHQLVDSCNRQGIDAAMLYLPGEFHKVPEAYSQYLVPTIAEHEIYPTDVVVVPEVMAGEVRRLSYARCVLWWLSVDNASGAALNIGADHIAQSFYAKDHLASHGYDALIVSDYVNPAFVDRGVERRPVVAANPVKGGELLAEFCHLNPDIEVVKIKDLDRDGVVGVLNEVSVFIDFGHQPGKDRPPREAARCGCVVFIRERGAARLPNDRPGLRSEYLFRSDQLVELGDMVRQVFADRAHHIKAQKMFRTFIFDEQVLFDSQVAAFAARFSQE